MTVNASQALASQQVGVREQWSGRRRLPTASARHVHRPVSQRWRERPRCPALRVAPGRRRRGRSRHRWPCRMSAALPCVCPQRTRRPRDRVRGSICPDDRPHQSVGELNRPIAMLSARCVCNHARRSRPGNIAHVSLAPCSASSMLYAPLRPGRRPGLRALTTPARGTVMAFARCLEIPGQRFDRGQRCCTPVDASAFEAYSLAIVGVLRGTSSASHSVHAERVSSRRSSSTTPTHTPARQWVIALAGSVWNRCAPRRASTRAL